MTKLMIIVPLLCALGACGGASTETHGKTEKPNAMANADDSPSEAEADPSAATSAPQDADVAIIPPEVAADPDALKLPVEAPLGAEVNAGVIPRAKLNRVLAQGIPHFLRSVNREAHLVNGRFTGWRILSLFANQPEVQVDVLRPGDTVRRANGQSMERPEQFKAVWDSMATAKELVLDIERAGRTSKLRYTIAD